MIYLLCGPTEKKAFYGFLDSLNNHEPPIIFKATLNKQKIDFLDKTIFKDPENENGLLTRVFFKSTDTHQLLHKDTFRPKYTFQGIMKCQISRFLRICSNITDVDEAWQILSQSLCKRNYSKRWLRYIKSKTVCELQIQQRRINPTNPTNSQWEWQM